MSLLIVDDCGDTRQTLQFLLESKGYEDVRGVSSGLEALAFLGEQTFTPWGATVEVILMDVAMPIMDGIEACRRLKEIPHLHNIPVLIVTGDAEESTLEAAFEAGACDYLTKPAHPIELLARVRSALMLKREFDRCKARADELARLTLQLQELNAELQRLAVIDELTGVANRRYFNQRFREDWGRAVRGKYPLALLLLDVDYFKNYNDYYGHQKGDECLRTVAETLAQGVRRATDLVARYGGEEFVILLPNTDQAGAEQIAEGLREQVEALHLPHAGSLTFGRVTISVGVAVTVPEHDAHAELLLSCADDAVYRAKRGGRNQVKTCNDAPIEV